MTRDRRRVVVRTVLRKVRESAEEEVNWHELSAVLAQELDLPQEEIEDEIRKIRQIVRTASGGP